MLKPRSFAVLLCVAACHRGHSPDRPAAPAPLPDAAAPPTAPAGPGAASLLADHFDQPSALAAWHATDGAVDPGPASASKVTLDDGSVRLEGAADTTHWRALERSAALAGASWVRVAARMKTDGLAPDGKHRPQCYIYVRFSDAGGKRVGDLVTSRNLLGTTPWTPVARRFAVPAGASNLTIGLFASLPGRAWFDDVVVEAAQAPDWHEATAGHYHYRWLAGDTVPDQAQSYNSESFRIASEFLGLGAAAPATVNYYKYPDKATKEELMGDPGNAFTLPDGSMHSIFATDRHEIVHVLARPWGDPPALIGEGLAVYLSGAWQGQPVASYAKGLVDQGWISLGDLLDSGAFRTHPDLSTYAIAGALIEWTLAQPDGKRKLQALYGKLQVRASAADNRATLEEILGAKLDDVDAQLRAWLRTR